MSAPPPDNEQASPNAEASSSTPQKVEKDPATRADELKALGNTAFKSKEYSTAIDYYTQAIGA